MKRIFKTINVNILYIRLKNTFNNNIAIGSLSLFINVFKWMLWIFSAYKIFNMFYDEYFWIYLIVFFMSGLITNYILKNYSYSENNYIRILERMSIWSGLFILLMICSVLTGGYLYFSDIEPDITSSIGGNEVQSTGDNINN